MKARIVNILILLLIVSSVTHFCFAQEECELTLNQALEEFNAGRFTSVSILLKDCLEKNQNREWRQRAHLLLAETSLLLEDAAGADENYLKVLQANPEYLTEKDRDPIDLVYLSSKFTATPIFSVYGKIGPNLSPVRVIHDVDVGGEAYTDEEYALKLGWHGSVGVDYNHNDNLVFSAESDFSYTVFEHRAYSLFGRGKDRVVFNDRQSWLSIPLMAKYTDDKGLVRPYGYVGYAFNLLLGDRGSIHIINNNAGDGDTPLGQEAESPAFNFITKRNIVNRSVLIGGGVKYKWKLNYFFVDLRYSAGLTNIVKPSSRYDDTNYRWPYVDDDFRLDNLALSIGYLHPFYKPRKLQKARTKSVLRKIKKNETAD